MLIAMLEYNQNFWAEMFEFEIYFDKKILFPNKFVTCSYTIFLYALHKNDSHNFKGLLYLKKSKQNKKIHIYN